MSFNWETVGINPDSFKYRKKEKEINPLKDTPKHTFILIFVEKVNGYLIYQHQDQTYRIYSPQIGGNNYTDPIPSLEYARTIAKHLPPPPTLRDEFIKRMSHKRTVFRE